MMGLLLGTFFKVAYHYNFQEHSQELLHVSSVNKYLAFFNFRNSQKIGSMSGKKSLMAHVFNEIYSQNSRELKFNMWKSIIMVGEVSVRVFHLKRILISFSPSIKNTFVLCILLVSSG